jgi:hypothetical protein
MFRSVLSSQHHSTNAPYSYVIRLPPTPYFRGSTALEGLRLLIEVSRPYSDTSHQAGLLCMSDRPVAETSTWQHHITLTRDGHFHGPHEIRTRNPSKPTAADSRLRRRGHRDRRRRCIITSIDSVSKWKCLPLSLSPCLIVTWTDLFTRQWTGVNSNGLTEDSHNSTVYNANTDVAVERYTCGSTCSYFSISYRHAQFHSPWIATYGKDTPLCMPGLSRPALCFIQQHVTTRTFKAL